MAVPTIARLSPLPAANVRAARESLATVDEAIEQLRVEDEGRWERRAIRENRHAMSGRHHMCGGCSKPLRAVNENCPCGFNNNIRGRRNLGGYR